jgi:hypothetical protein
MEYNPKNRIRGYFEKDSVLEDNVESLVEKYESWSKMGHNKKDLEDYVESSMEDLEKKVNANQECLGEIYFEDCKGNEGLTSVILSFPDINERIDAINELGEFYSASKSKYAKKLLIETSLENDCTSVKNLAQTYLGYSDFRLNFYKNFKNLKEKKDVIKNIFFGGALIFLFYEFYNLLRNIAK